MFQNEFETKSQKRLVIQEHFETLIYLWIALNKTIFFRIQKRMKLMFLGWKTLTVSLKTCLFVQILSTTKQLWMAFSITPHLNYLREIVAHDTSLLLLSCADPESSVSGGLALQL